MKQENNTELFSICKLNGREESPKAYHFVTSPYSFPSLNPLPAPVRKKYAESEALGSIIYCSAMRNGDYAPISMKNFRSSRGKGRLEKSNKILVNHSYHFQKKDPSKNYTKRYMPNWEELTFDEITEALRTHYMRVKAVDFSEEPELERVTIEFDLAVKLVADNVDEAYVRKNVTQGTYGHYYKGTLIEGDPDAFVAQKVKEIYARHILSALDIKQGRKFCVRTTEPKKRKGKESQIASNRLFTSVSNLPTYMIEALRLDEEALMEMDIKNSQPTIAGSEFIKEAEKVLSEDKEMKGLLKNTSLINETVEKAENNQKENKGNKGRSLKNTSLINKTVEEKSLKHEVERLKEMLSTGDLYTEFAQSAGIESRSAAKTAIFRVLYGQGYSTKYSRAFRSFSPHFYDWILEKKKMDAWYVFPVKMQRIEVVMIEEVKARLRGEGIDCLSRHDSVLVKRSQQPRALEIMKEVLGNHLIAFQIK